MTKEPKRDPAETAHDDREIDARRIGGFAVGVVVLTGVAMALMWGFDLWVTKSEQAHHPAPPPLADERPIEPPDPKLQRMPKGGLAALRAEEEAQLTTYKWINRKDGIVQIPVERAIELLARRQLPARRLGPPVENPQSEPTESSLGIKKKERKE